jgi:hypothetical protein
MTKLEDILAGVRDGSYCLDDARDMIRNLLLWPLADGAEKHIGVQPVVSRWRPNRCPITMRPFFMWIEHPDLGEVPTYGGPFDSYTIPEPIIEELIIPEGKIEFQDIEFTCHHYDHDFGGWVEDEDPGMRVVRESRLVDLGAWAANAGAHRQAREAGLSECSALLGGKGEK